MVFCNNFVFIKFRVAIGRSEYWQNVKSNVKYAAELRSNERMRVFEVVAQKEFALKAELNSRHRERQKGDSDIKSYECCRPTYMINNTNEGTCFVVYYWQT